MVNLEGGTPEQKALFERAFAALPKDIAAIIDSHHIIFSPSKVSLGRGSAQIVNNNILISPHIFVNNTRSLTGVILGYGLAQIYSQQIQTDNPSFQAALREEIKRTFPEQKFSASQLNIILESQKIIPLADRLGNVLAGAYIDLNNPSLQNSVKDLLADRTTFYEDFLNKVREIQPAISESQAAPPILIDPKYGESVTQQDIETFLAGYNNWDDWVKQAVDNAGITFVMGRGQPTFGRNRMYDPALKQVELDIDETNKKDFRIDGQSVALFSALLCMMHNKLPLSFDWDVSEKEMIKAARAQGIADIKHISPTSILASVHRTLKQGHRSVLKKDTPLSLGMYEQFMDLARQEAKRLENLKIGYPLQPPAERIIFSGDGDHELHQNLLAEFRKNIPEHVRQVIFWSQPTFHLDWLAKRDSWNPDNDDRIDLTIKNRFKNGNERTVLAMAGYGLCRALHCEVPLSKNTIDKAAKEFIKAAVKAQGLPNSANARAQEMMAEFNDYEKIAEILGEAIWTVQRGGTLSDAPAIREIYNGYMNAARNKVRSYSYTQTASAPDHELDILINPEQAGKISPNYINKLKAITDNWPQKYKALMVDRGVKFMIVSGATNDEYREIQNKYPRYVIVGTGLLNNTTPIYITAEKSLFYHGLKNALGTAIPNVDWEKARHAVADEYPGPKSKAVREAITDAGREYSILGLADAMIKDKSKSCPSALSDLHQNYMAYADNAYEELLQRFNKGITAELTTSNNAFAIYPPALTKPQKAYFEHVNKLVELLGVTPKEFDNQFRYCAAHQETALNYQSAEIIAKKNPGMPSINIPWDKIGAPKIALQVKLNGAISALKPNDYQAFDKNKTQAAKSYYPVFDSLTGSHNFPLPINATPEEYFLHDIHKQTPLSNYTGSSIKLGIPAETNVLQLYAVGNIPFNRLEAIRKEGVSKYLPVHYPAVSSIFQVSVQNAAHVLADKKAVSLDVRTAINEHLKAMEELWPQVVMDHSRYAEYAKLEAAAESRKCEPYILHQKEALRLSEENPSLYEREIKPILDRLSVKIPMHNELGEALFADAVVEVLEAVACGDVARVKTLVENENVKTALATAENLVTQAQKTKLDDIQPIEQRHHHKALQEQLGKPGLLISALQRGAIQRMLDDAVKPLPYLLAEGSIAAKIRDYALKDPTKVADPIASREIALRAELWKEMKPLVTALASGRSEVVLLNRKSEIENQWGDALLSNNIMAVAASLMPKFADKAVKAKRDIEPVMQDLAEATQPARLVLQQLLAQHDSPDARADALSQYIRACPVLLVCASGDAELIQELGRIDLNPASKASFAQKAIARIMPQLENTNSTVPEVGPRPDAASPEVTSIIPVETTATPVPVVPPAIALAGAAGVAAAEDQPVETPAEVPVPSSPAAPPPLPKTPAPVFANEYERLRDEAHHKALYIEAEKAALSSARYLAEEWALQHECNELNCRIVRSSSGHEIWLSFGKDGHAVSEQVVRLRKGTHIDDAVDILYALEGMLYDENGPFKLVPPLGHLEKAKKEAVKPPVQNINLLRDDQLPQMIVQLNPDEIPLDGSARPRIELPTTKGPSIEAKVTNVNDAAILTIRSWFASKRTGRKCCTLNIPLGVKFADTEKVEERKAYALTFMQEYLGIGEEVTKQHVIDELKGKFNKGPGDWFEAKSIEVDGYEAPRELINFPHPDYNQHTWLSAAHIYERPQEGGKTHAVQFHIDIKDDNIDSANWHHACPGYVNLHTSDPELAKARAHWVMDRVVGMFETLNQGQNAPNKAFLPSEHYWELGEEKNGERFLKGSPKYSPAVRDRHQKTLKHTDQAYLDYNKIKTYIDYFAGTFEDDLSVRPVNIQHKADYTEFTLQLVRATRENYPETYPNPEIKPSQRLTNPYYRTVEYGGTDPVLPGETIHMDHPTQKGTTYPVEVTFKLNVPANSQMSSDDRMRVIQGFANRLDATVKNTTSTHYKAFVWPESGGEYIKAPEKEFRTSTIVNDFVDAITRHEPTFPEMEIQKDKLQSDLAKRFGKRGTGGGRIKPGAAQYMPDELANGPSMNNYEMPWADKIERSIMTGNRRLH